MSIYANFSFPNPKESHVFPTFKREHLLGYRFKNTKIDIATGRGSRIWTCNKLGSVRMVSHPMPAITRELSVSRLSLNLQHDKPF